jgi:methyl-accepting chemotaxis protein
MQERSDGEEQQVEEAQASRAGHPAEAPCRDAQPSAPEQNPERSPGLTRLGRRVLRVAGVAGMASALVAGAAGFAVARLGGVPWWPGQSPLAGQWAAVAVAGLAAGLSLWALLWFCLRRTLCAPLREVHAACLGAEQGDYGRLPSADLPAELGEVGRCLRQVFSGVRRQVDDAQTMRKQAFKEAHKAAKALRRAEREARRAESAHAQGLEQAASRLEEVAERLREHSGRVLDVVRDAGEASRSQQQELTEAAGVVERMSEAATRVSSHAARAAELSGEAARQAGQGADLARRSDQAVERLGASYAGLTRNMDRLARETGSIEQVIAVISDIADQTNLLALNAAIEAARAGEAGRGFAVVADEVRKLAEKTMHATGEVGRIVDSVRGAARDNIESMHEAGGAIEAVRGLVRDSGVALEHIVAATRDAGGRVRDIAAAFDAQAEDASRVRRMIDSTCKVSQGTVQAMVHSCEALEGVVAQADDLQGILEGLRRDGAAVSGVENPGAGRPLTRESFRESSTSSDQRSNFRGSSQGRTGQESRSDSSGDREPSAARESGTSDKRGLGRDAVAQNRAAAKPDALLTSAPSEEGRTGLREDVSTAARRAHKTGRPPEPDSNRGPDKADRRPWVWNRSFA